MEMGLLEVELLSAKNALVPPSPGRYTVRNEKQR